MVEVNRPHAHTRRRRGKSDPIDAEMAARQAQAGHAVVIPKRTDGIVEAIRQLRVACESAVKARTAALNQLTELIVTAPAELRQQLRERKTSRGRATLCARLRPDLERLHEPLQAAKLALRSLARRVSELDHEIAALDAHLKPLVATAAPRTTQLLAISTGHAGQLLVTADENIDRLRHRRRLRRALRRQPDPRRLRPARPPPPQPRRRPQRQPHPAHDRRLPPALLRTHPRLRPAPHRRRQDQARDHPLPQTLHRPRDLPRPARRPRRTHNPQPCHAITTRHARPWQSRSAVALARSDAPDDALDIYRNVPGRLRATR